MIYISFFAGCKALNLTGMCCPSPEGLFLGCCDTSSTTASTGGGNSAVMIDEWKSLLFAELAGKNGFTFHTLNYLRFLNLMPQNRSL